MVNVRLLVVCFILAIAFGSTLILQSDYITEIGTCEPEEDPSTVVSWGRNLQILSTPPPFSDGRKWLCKGRARAKAAEEWVRPYAPITLYGVCTASLISFGLLLLPELFAFLYIIVFILRCVGRLCLWILVDDDGGDLYDDDDDDDESHVTYLGSKNSSSSLLTNVENEISIVSSPEATSNDKIVYHSDETQSIDKTFNTKCGNGEVSAHDFPHTCVNEIADERLKASDNVNDLDNDRIENANTAEVVDVIVPSKAIGDHSSISSPLFDDSNPAESSTLANSESLESQADNKDCHGNTGLTTGNRSKYTKLDIQRAICRVEIMHLLSVSPCSTSGKASHIQSQYQFAAEHQGIVHTSTTTIDNPPARYGLIQPLNHLPALAIEDGEHPCSAIDETELITYNVLTPHYLKDLSDDNKDDMILALTREEQDTSASDYSVTNPESSFRINVDNQLSIEIDVQHLESSEEMVPCNNSNNGSIQIENAEDTEPCSNSSNVSFRLESAEDVETCNNSSKASLQLESAEHREPCSNSSNGSSHQEELATLPQFIIKHECAKKDALRHGQSDGEMYSPALTDYYARRFISAVESLAKKVDQTAGITLDKRMSMMRLQKAVQYGKISFPKGRASNESNAPTIYSGSSDDNTTSAGLFPLVSDRKRHDVLVSSSDQYSNTQTELRKGTPRLPNQSHTWPPISEVKANVWPTSMQSGLFQSHSGQISFHPDTVQCTSDRQHQPCTHFEDGMLSSSGDDDGDDDEDEEAEWSNVSSNEESTKGCSAVTRRTASW